jgi:predicted SprT family Zn-dependent metalloprotease
MTEEFNNDGTANIELKKKGRKPKQANYFDVREEMAVIRFLSADTFEEKNQIYNEYLRKPLDKMISSIIRRYKLYRKDMNFTEIHIDTHSFLMTKIDKFKPAKEKKAYSYFGTICKNYLMGQIIKDQKDMNRKISYEDISTDLENNPSFSYSIDNDSLDSETIIKNFITQIELLIEDETLNENELKLGHALYEIFQNYDDIFIGTSNNKFNKNIILLSLMEMTNLSTKEIRSSMKKYKVIYYGLVQGMLK